MKVSSRSELATVALVAVLVAAVGLLAWWTLSGGNGASAQQGNSPRERLVTVSVGTAVRKDMPYRLEAPGTVQPMVSIAVRARVDSQIEKVHFEDGASVKAGEILFTLDARSIEAQILQADAQLARNRASLEKAKRDVERMIGLVERGTTSQVALDDARTNVAMLLATIQQDEANLENLRVQRSYYEILSPATGRIGISGVRPGAVVRTADVGTPLAVVNQMSPIYAAFGVPERYIPDLRAAGNNARVDATPQNAVSVHGGKVAFIDNTVDPQTGTIMVRGLFDNKDEKLWPGMLVGIKVTLRVDSNVVTVPQEAVQSGQRGSFVFVVENGTAKVRQVTVARMVEGEAVISAGLNGGETVVTDGQLSLRDGSRVNIKRAGA